MIDWLAFVVVLGASFLGACTVVSTYALGLRLLTVSGRAPIVSPLEFTDAIAVVSPAEAAAEAKRVAKAAKRNPLTPMQRRLAYAGAWVCFGASGLAVLLGIALIVPALQTIG